MESQGWFPWNPRVGCPWGPRVGAYGKKNNAVNNANAKIMTGTLKLTLTLTPYLLTLTLALTSLYWKNS